MAFRRLLGAALAAAALIGAAAPAAAADNYPVRDGTGTSQTFCSKLSSAIQWPCHLLGALFSGTPGLVSAGQQTKANSLPVVLPSDPDIRSSTSNITAADAATSTIAGQSSVTLVTGSPTANSSIVWALNGHASATIAASGTFSLTAQIETSADGGVTYAPAVAKILGSGATTGSITAPGVFRVDVTGMTHIRLRASAFTSGTLTALMNASAAPGLNQVLNPQRLADSTGTVMGVSGNPLTATLATSSAVIGKAGIDQTTPGTTNNVAASSIQGGIVVTPTVTASSAYASGNTLGGLLTLTGAVRTSGGTALLQKVVINLKSNNMTPTDVLIFSANPTGTTVTDKTAINVAVADFDKLAGVVHVTDCTNVGTPVVCQANGLAMSLVANGSANLYAVAVTRGTPTFSATSDVSINFVFIKD